MTAQLILIFQVTAKLILRDLDHEFRDHQRNASKDSGLPGARLTKAYDITIQSYHNSHTKIQDSKMRTLQCMGSKFCVKFQRAPLKFHTKFWIHTLQNMHLWGVKYLTTYDILEIVRQAPEGSIISSCYMSDDDWLWQMLQEDYGLCNVL